MKYVFFILVIFAIAIYANTFVTNDITIDYTNVQKNLSQDSIKINGSTYYNIDGIYKKVQ